MFQYVWVYLKLSYYDGEMYFCSNWEKDSLRYLNYVVLIGFFLIIFVLKNRVKRGYYFCFVNVFYLKRKYLQKF